MDEIKPENEATVSCPSNGTNSAISSIFSQVPLKLQNIFKPYHNRPENAVEQNHSSKQDSRKEKKSLTDWRVELDKQLQLWRENPIWGDQTTKIDVSVPKGSLCNLYVKFDLGLPPDAVYNIVTDPDNKRVFKNIKEVISRKVLLDDGSRQVVELEQAAIWKFLWWTGTLAVHVLVDQNRDDHSMKFKQVKAGFMKKFEGCWKIEPVFVDKESCLPFKPQTLSDYSSCTSGKGRIGSRVTLEQLLQPAIVPPPPISWYLRGITAKTTEMLLTDMIAEAARIKGISDANFREDTPLQENSNDIKLDCPDNIKERWALRRRNARNHRVKLLP